MLVDLEQDADVVECSRAACEALRTLHEVDHGVACAALATGVTDWLYADGPIFNWLTPIDIEASGTCRGATVERCSDGDRAYGVSSQGDVLLEYVGEPIRSWTYAVEDGELRQVITWTPASHGPVTVAVRVMRFSAAARCNVFASVNAHGYEYRGAWRVENGRSRLVYDWYELPPPYYRHPARRNRPRGVTREFVAELAEDGSVRRVECTTTGELVWYSPH